jgi:hypothetical protein
MTEKILESTYVFFLSKFWKINGSHYLEQYLFLSTIIQKSRKFDYLLLGLVKKRKHVYNKNILFKINIAKW